MLRCASTYVAVCGSVTSGNLVEFFNLIFDTVVVMERLYMETQDGLKTTALPLFLNSFFHFLPAAALCDDFSLVDSVET